METNARQAAATPVQAKPAHLQARSNTATTNQERQRRQHLVSLESEIASLESQITALSRQLENPPADPGKVMRLGNDYQQLQQSLDRHLEEWAAAAEQV
jgi:hypothetical protein